MRVYLVAKSLETHAGFFDSILFLWPFQRLLLDNVLYIFLQPLVAFKSNKSLLNLILCRFLNSLEDKQASKTPSLAMKETRPRMTILDVNVSIAQETPAASKSSASQGVQVMIGLSVRMRWALGRLRIPPDKRISSRAVSAQNSENRASRDKSRVCPRTVSTCRGVIKMAFLSSDQTRSCMKQCSWITC